ncbi:hypothetical protein DYB28_008777 [Aphanomyces astaci]|uniref:Retrotransposon gag domain-containing protein n=1 Tax=Aphanomyces astaci TaxID=112090 RepID=A0A397ET64_APHAT|nr:hypothetical protein DYB31_014575 [Aphanomyces astaci]RLO00464.1 hypothetical protein DYB28_008777 [Aphanomyces astaci]
MKTQQLVPPYEVTVHHACRLSMYHEGGREVTEDLELRLDGNFTWSDLMRRDIVRLTRASESETPSTSRLKSINLDVAKFGGAESDKLLRWLLQVSTAADAQRIPDDATRVAFAMSHLKGRAEDWAFSKRLTDHHCFPSFAVFETELKAMFLPPNSDFRYRSQHLACKQGKRSLEEFIHYG